MGQNVAARICLFLTDILHTGDTSMRSVLSSEILYNSSRMETLSEGFKANHMLLRAGVVRLLTEFTLIGSFHARRVVSAFPWKHASVQATLCGLLTLKSNRVSSRWEGMSFFKTVQFDRPTRKHCQMTSTFLVDRLKVSPDLDLVMSTYVARQAIVIFFLHILEVGSDNAVEELLKREDLTVAVFKGVGRDTFADSVAFLTRVGSLLDLAGRDWALPLIFPSRVCIALASTLRRHSRGGGLHTQMIETASEAVGRRTIGRFRWSSCERLLSRLIGEATVVTDLLDESTNSIIDWETAADILKLWGSSFSLPSLQRTFLSLVKAQPEAFVVYLRESKKLSRCQPCASSDFFMRVVGAVRLMKTLTGRTVERVVEHILRPVLDQIQEEKLLHATTTTASADLCTLLQPDPFDTRKLTAGCKAPNLLVRYVSMYYAIELAALRDRVLASVSEIAGRQLTEQGLQLFRHDFLAAALPGVSQLLPGVAPAHLAMTFPNAYGPADWYELSVDRAKDDGIELGIEKDSTPEPAKVSFRDVFGFLQITCGSLLSVPRTATRAEQASHDEDEDSDSSINELEEVLETMRPFDVYDCGSVYLEGAAAFCLFLKAVFDSYPMRSSNKHFRIVNDCMSMLTALGFSSRDVSHHPLLVLALQASDFASGLRLTATSPPPPRTFRVVQQEWCVALLDRWGGSVAGSPVWREADRAFRRFFRWSLDDERSVNIMDAFMTGLAKVDASSDRNLAPHVGSAVLNIIVHTIMFPAAFSMTKGVPPVLAAALMHLRAAKTSGYSGRMTYFFMWPMPEWSLAAGASPLPKDGEGARSKVGLRLAALICDATVAFTLSGGDVKAVRRLIKKLGPWKNPLLLKDDDAEAAEQPVNLLRSALLDQLVVSPLEATPVAKPDEYVPEVAPNAPVQLTPAQQFTAFMETPGYELPDYCERFTDSGSLDVFLRCLGKMTLEESRRHSRIFSRHLFNKLCGFLISGAALPAHHDTLFTLMDVVGDLLSADEDEKKAFFKYTRKHMNEVRVSRPTAFNVPKEGPVPSGFHLVYFFFTFHNIDVLANSKELRPVLQRICDDALVDHQGCLAADSRLRTPYVVLGAKLAAFDEFQRVDKAKAAWPLFLQARLHQGASWMDWDGSQVNLTLENLDREREITQMSLSRSLYSTSTDSLRRLTTSGKFTKYSLAPSFCVRASCTTMSIPSEESQQPLDHCFFIPFLYSRIRIAYAYMEEKCRPRNDTNAVFLLLQMRHLPDRERPIREVASELPEGLRAMLGSLEPTGEWLQTFIERGSMSLLLQGLCLTRDDQSRSWAWLSISMLLDLLDVAMHLNENVTERRLRKRLRRIREAPSSNKRQKLREEEELRKAEEDDVEYEYNFPCALPFRMLLMHLKSAYIRESARQETDSPVLERQGISFLAEAALIMASTTHRLYRPVMRLLCLDPYIVGGNKLAVRKLFRQHATSEAQASQLLGGRILKSSFTGATPAALLGDGARGLGQILAVCQERGACGARSLTMVTSSLVRLTQVSRHPLSNVADDVRALRDSGILAWIRDTLPFLLEEAFAIPPFLVSVLSNSDKNPVVEIADLDNSSAGPTVRLPGCSMHEFTRARNLLQDHACQRVYGAAAAKCFESQIERAMSQTFTVSVFQVNSVCLVLSDLSLVVHQTRQLESMDSSDVLQELGAPSSIVKSALLFVSVLASSLN
ncbi:MAG: uncharacterized protein KVP18_004605 [Porospora cf. gigantea A]|nr:MAG: hypothetical protein KVP18_004605 [Porospora cf. gigantea A]